MRKRIEQDQCCEAVLRMFETCFGSKWSDIVFPEKCRRSTGEVEICVTIGSTKLAIEHTLIEPMRDFVKANHYFSHFITEFDKLVPHDSIPASHAFQLFIPGMALKKKKKKNMRLVTKAIADLAIENMMMLANPLPDDHSILSDILQAMSKAIQEHDIGAISKAWAMFVDVRSSRRPPTSIEAAPHGVSFSVTLRITPNPLPSHLGTLQVIRLIDDIEEKRLQRVINALKSKKSKLERCREQCYRTVLVLENNDIALTSDQAVFEALSSAQPSVDAAADNIFLANTRTRNYILRHFVVNGQVNTRWYTDWVEFDANNLDTSKC